MVKDIEWAKETITKQIESYKNPYDNEEWLGATPSIMDGRYQGLNYALNIMNQMEVETLSPEWINDHTDKFIGDDGNRFVSTNYLQNILVPKQELTYEDTLKIIAERHNTDEFSIGLYLEALIHNKKYEFLSERWINDNTSPADGEGRLYVWKRDLESVIVPKQEEVTEEAHENHYNSESVDWEEVLERYKWHLEEEGYTVIEKPTISPKLANRIQELKERNSPIAILLGDGYFTNLGNQEDVIKAWLAYPNVEIKEERKYYVLNRERDTVILTRNFDEPSIDPVPITEVEKVDQFTEQEIRDFDEGFMYFAVPVEEVGY